MWLWRVKRPIQNFLMLLLLLMLMLIPRYVLFWSRFVKELLIWPKEVTLVSRTQPSGPLYLWQCLYNILCYPAVFIPNVFICKCVFSKPCPWSVFLHSLVCPFHMLCPYLVSSVSECPSAICLTLRGPWLARSLGTIWGSILGNNKPPTSIHHNRHHHHHYHHLCKIIR